MRRQLVSRMSLLWLITDLNKRSDYVRFTPESGHAITDVRFSTDYVR